MTSEESGPLLHASSLSARLFSKLIVPLALVYVFFTMFRPPTAATTGLDPSWQLVLSEGAINGVVHGRDILFTYGPLGFLVAGKGIPELYLFLSVIHALIALGYLLVVFHRSHEFRSAILRVVFVLLAGLLALYAELDYILLFTFFLVVTRPTVRLRPSLREALLYGAAAAVAMLIKPTLTIDILGFLLLYYGTLALAAKSSASLHLVGGVVASFLATFFVSFELVRISPVGFTVLIVCAIVALLALQRALVTPTIYVTSRGVSYSLLVAALVAVALIGLDGPARDYVRASVEFAAGYSSALVFPGSDLIRAIAVFEAALAALVVVSVRFEIGNGVALACLYTIWASFKHGFVRQDTHVLFYFVTVAALTFALVLSTTEPAARRRLGVLACSAALALVLLDQYSLNFGAYRGMFPAAVREDVQALFRLRDVAAGVATGQDAALAMDRLPPQMRAALGNEPVDIEPWEAAAATENRLNWHPLPVFQSYAAYTRWLENRNASVLASNGPQVVLLSLRDIDGRSQITDEPTVWRELMCRYHPAPSDSFTLDQVQAMEFVRGPAACGNARAAGVVTAHIGEPIAVPHQRNAWTALTIQLHYSPFGVMKKLVYRASLMTLTLRYSDRSTLEIRLIPEVLGTHQAVFISPFPRAVEDFPRLFEMRERNVSSITFHTDDERAFQPSVTAGFEIVDTGP